MKTYKKGEGKAQRTDGLILAALLGLLLASCNREAQQPDTFDENGVHLVSHKRGTCRLCDLYDEAKGYVVRIVRGDGMGAGVVITSDGIIVTNAHVVRRAQEVRVETFEGRKLLGKVVTADSSQDLALLRVESTEVSWTPVAIVAGVQPPVGSEVYVIGHPAGLGWTVTRGIISAYRRGRGVQMIQTDAAISPGSSGGPLLDKVGHLIGIVTGRARREGVENVAFARPTSALLEFLRREGVIEMPERR